MKNLNVLVLILLVALTWPLALFPRASAAAEPGYIAGEVTFPGFATTSLSLTAVGGGKTSQLTTHDSSSYQMTVDGGEAYSLSSSCGLSGGNNNALTVYFSQRSVAVPPGGTVVNDYVYNPGTIRFQLNITGEATSSSAAAGSWAIKNVTTGEKTATFSSGTPATSARSYAWDLPVVPNQLIELTAKIDVTGPSGVKRYTFSKTAASPYTLAPRDVAPGEVVIVPLEINFADAVTPPAAPNNTGTIDATVNLLGLPAADFDKTVANTITMYTNPATHSRNVSFSGNQLATSVPPPTTFFKDSVDAYPSLRWPYINGYSSNHAVTVYPGTTSYFDIQREGGFLTGRVNLSGTYANEDLSAITFTFDGQRVWIPGTGWKQLENFFGNVALKRDAVAANIKRPAVRDYRMFLPTGDWNLSEVTLNRQLSSPARTSSVTFRDYTTQYDGQTSFGTPLHIEPGDNARDFDYCLGSAVVRFRDPQGRLLKNPTVTGRGTHQTNGAVDLNVTNITANSTESNVATTEVELFGPPANYSLITIRVQTVDNQTLSFPTRNLSLTCNTTKTLDFPGPVLTVTAPQAEIVTSAQALPVSGRASAGSPVGSVTVNGQAAALTPVAGGSPNEVDFTRELSLADGDNLVTVTATETTGAQATEQLFVFVDRWLPTLAIAAPADGTQFLNTDPAIPVNVTAADRGYGYTLTVSLDGTPIHSAKGTGNSAEPAEVVYDQALQGLALGEHVISVTVSDLAGNSVSASSTITVALYEPPPVLYGLADQLVEATSAAGAVASFEVTATSECNGETLPTVFPSPVLASQGNSASAGAATPKTFQWQAVTAEDGDPVHYQVQVSATLDFSTIQFSSAWQAATTWTQSLPMGTWYWRVFARDSAHPELQSPPAVGNSFSVLSDGSPITRQLAIQHYTDCTLSGGVYPEAGPMIWAGPFEGWDVDRSFLTFDTSSLGVGATVTVATLKLDFRDREFLANSSVTNVHESTWQFPGDSSTYHNVGPVLASQSIAVGRPFGIVPFSIRPDYIAATGITRFALAAANENYNTLWSADPGYARATSSLEVTYLPDTSAWTAPTLMPQANVTSAGDHVATTFQWQATAAADGDPVQYLVEISSTVDFSVVNFNSGWQAATAWTQPLPLGTWYWRVTARDAVHVATLSNPAAGGYTVSYQPLPTPPGAADVTCTPASGSTFPLGATDVACTATDPCNRSATGSFTVTVRDATPPQLILPGDLAVDATSAAGASVVFAATAIDTVDPAPVVYCSPESGSTFPVGQTTVNCTAMDASGNFTSGSFQVTVQETAPPVLTVPADVTAEASGLLTAVAIGQATATHNLEVTLGNDAPAAFPVGTTVVTWTATAANGKSATGVQNVTVVDTVAPAVSAPANLTVEASGPLTAVETGLAAAADAVGVVSVTSNAPATFPVGATVVTWTATDAAGNAGTAAQTVTVADSAAPQVTAPANLTVEASGLFTPVAIGLATAADAVGVVSVTSNAPASFPVGATVVTWTATDAAGNAGTAVQTVTVADTTPPVFSALTNQTFEATGSLTPIALGMDIVASDAVGVVSVTSNAPAAFPVGVTTVTWTATDAAGNAATVVQTVTVRDTTAPLLTVPANITVLLNTSLGAGPVQDFLNGATATDAVDPSVAVTATPPQALNTVGARPVTFTAADDAGNVTTRTATINVVYGGGEQFMEPVSLLKPFKQGSTVPVKIAFADASGAAVTSAVVRLFLYPVSNDVPAEEPLEITDPGAADTGNLFKVTGDEYHYNLKTTNLAEGTYQIRAVLDDGTYRAVPLALK